MSVSRNLRLRARVNRPVELSAWRSDVQREYWDAIDGNGVFLREAARANLGKWAKRAGLNVWEMLQKMDFYLAPYAETLQADDRMDRTSRLREAYAAAIGCIRPEARNLARTLITERAGQARLDLAEYLSREGLDPRPYIAACRAESGSADSKPQPRVPAHGDRVAGSPLPLAA